MATTKKTNTADNELAKVVESSLPFLEKHGNTLLLGLAAVLGIAALAIFASKWSNVGGDEEGWAMMSAARATEDYAKIAEQYPGTNVGMWAKLIEADSYQQSAVQLSFTDREASRNELERARKQYDSLLKMNLSPEVEEKALFGVAKCIEAACTGDTSEAIAAYQAVLTKHENSIYKDAIEKRIADLNKSETKEFYTFWATQDPKPGDRVAPNDSGATPFGNQSISLPETPLLLQQPGFNMPEKEMPPVPDFEPDGGAAMPIEPTLQSDEKPEPAKPSEEPVDEAKATEPAEKTEPTETAGGESATEAEAAKPETKPEPVPAAETSEPPANEPVPESAPEPAPEPAKETKPEAVPATEPAPEPATDGDSKSE